MDARRILLLAASALPLAAQIAPGDWPNYARDLAGTKYSPLDQITPGNVAKLIPAFGLSKCGLTHLARAARPTLLPRLGRQWQPHRPQPRSSSME